MTTPTPDLEHLLARSALGDRRCFEQLYRATSAQLYGLVLRIVKNHDSANEVLQEAYVKIWKRAGDFRADKAKPMTWLGAIARNQAIDLLRRSANQPKGGPAEELDWVADEAPGPEAQTDQTWQNRALRQCLQQLEGEQQQAVLLAYFRGMTHEELADHMQRPLGTVKSWLRRGLQRLKKCLEEA